MVLLAPASESAHRAGRKCLVKSIRFKLNKLVSEITVIVHFALHSITDIILHNITHSLFNKSLAWIKYGVRLGLKLMAWLSIKYNERNRNVYLGKVCAQMYTMKTRANEPTFSKNECKCAATIPSL